MTLWIARIPQLRQRRGQLPAGRDVPAACATQRCAVLLVMPNVIVSAESAKQLTQAPHDTRHEPHTGNPRIMRVGRGVWRNQHLRISGDHRLHPFPADKAVIQTCNSAPAAYDAGPRPHLAKNLDVGPPYSKLHASRTFASCFPYSNAAVLGIEQRPGPCLKKKTAVSLIGDFVASVVARESPRGQTCAPPDLSNLAGKLVRIRPTVRAFRILDENGPAGPRPAVVSGKGRDGEKSSRRMAGDQPSERMPRTTKPMFAGRSPRRRMK